MFSPVSRQLTVKQSSIFQFQASLTPHLKNLSFLSTPTSWSLGFTNSFIMLFILLCQLSYYLLRISHHCQVNVNCILQNVGCTKTARHPMCFCCACQKCLILFFSVCDYIQIFYTFFSVAQDNSDQLFCSPVTNVRSYTGILTSHFIGFQLQMES